MYLSMNVIVPLILRNEVGNNPSAQGIVNNILLLIAIIILRSYAMFFTMAMAL